MITEHLRQAQTASSQSVRSLYGEQTSGYQRARVNLLQGHPPIRIVSPKELIYANDDEES